MESGAIARNHAELEFEPPCANVEMEKLEIEAAKVRLLEKELATQVNVDVKTVSDFNLKTMRNHILSRDTFSHYICGK